MIVGDLFSTSLSQFVSLNPLIPTTWDRQPLDIPSRDSAFPGPNDFTQALHGWCRMGGVSCQPDLRYHRWRPLLGT